MSIISKPTVKCKPFKVNSSNPFIYSIPLKGGWVQINQAFVRWLIDFGDEKLGVDHARGQQSIT